MVIGFLFCVSIFIDFFWEVLCANSFTVHLLSVGLSVAGSVIIFAPLSKLKLTKASSNQLWAYHSLLFSKPEFLSFMLGARMKWNSSDENINISYLPSAFHFVVVFSFLIPLSYSLLSLTSSLLHFQLSFFSIRVEGIVLQDQRSHGRKMW